MAKAETLFDHAEAAVKSDAALLQRVQIARLPLRYVWAVRWHELQDQAARENLPWPGPSDYVENAGGFSTWPGLRGDDDLRGRALLGSFERRTIGMGRVKSPPPPGCETCPASGGSTCRTSPLTSARGHLATIEKDEQASDKTAARMPSTHYEWAVQQSLLGKPLEAGAVYDVYASIRVDKTGSAGGPSPRESTM